MSLKFSITHNTPTDWVKSIVAGVTAGLAALQAAQLDNVLNTADYLSIGVAAITAFATVLGVYSVRDEQPQPDVVVDAVYDEAFTFQPESAAQPPVEVVKEAPPAEDDATLPPVV